MSRAAAEWFVHEDEWHLCHLCHLCRLCHHGMEGGGHLKVCCDTCRDMGKLLRAPTYLRSSVSISIMKFWRHTMWKRPFLMIATLLEHGQRMLGVE